ncbi:MAG: hypothetical protein GU362_03590 [Thaumarchaeota archaeon]|nr:hypothetical protein [Nitrososphaerota archaeon]
MKDKRLGELIISAISDYGDETLAKTILWYMKNKKKMDIDEISERPEEFVAFLKDVYGPFEHFIEEMMIEKISQAYGVPKENDLVTMIKRLFENKI